MTALTWLKAGIVPGLWLVFSGWSPEFVPDRKGEPMADCECQALAVVLSPPSSFKLNRPCFQVVAGEVSASHRPLDLTSLAGLLDQSSREPAGGRGLTAIISSTIVITARDSRNHISPRELAGESAHGRFPVTPLGRLRVELGATQFHHVKEVG